MPATSRHRSDNSDYHIRFVAWGWLVNGSGDHGGQKLAEFAGDRAYSSPDIWLGHKKPGSVYLHNPVLPRVPKGWQATD